MGDQTDTASFPVPVLNLSPNQPHPEGSRKLMDQTLFNECRITHWPNAYKLKLNNSRAMGSSQS